MTRNTFSGAQVRSTPATSLRWRVACFAITLSGIFLRIYHFVDNRSLWEDELFLASSLISMDLGALMTGPLDYYQRAPLGFLWAVKLCVMLFGSQEMALRLFPLICGITSLFAFLPVARYFLRPAGTLIALCMLSIAPPLVYHAVEVKQYGPEMLATILALWWYIIYRNKTDWWSLIAWGMGGALLLWFSFTSLFVLAGIGCGVGLVNLVKYRRPVWVRSLLPFLIWGISFGVQYFLIIGRYADEAWLTDFWERRQAFFPKPPAFLAEVKWLVYYVYSFVYYPLGLTWFEVDYTRGYSDWYRLLMRMPFIPLLLLLTSVAMMFRCRQRDFAMLAMIILIAITASAMRFYPLHERLSVFLAPIGILFVAYACDWLETRRVTWLRYFAVLVLLAAPFTNSLWAVVDVSRFGGYKKSYQREAWMYVQQHYREGDLVYIYWNDLPGWNYYKQAYGLNMQALEGRDVRHIARGFPDYFQHLAPDIREMKKHARVWIVYRHYNGMKTGDFEGRPEWYYQNVNAVEQLHTHLITLGKETDVFHPVDGAQSDIYIGLFVFD